VTGLFNHFAAVQSHELVVDLFAGGGGASSGIEAALGRPVDIAVNHSAAAIAVHTTNHPRTRHHQESVWNVDPRTATGGRRVGLLWASPDCTHFSRAKGGKPRSKKKRSLACAVTRWAKAVRPRVIVVENVAEFEHWGPLLADDKPCPKRKGKSFRAWVAKLRRYGYAVDWRLLVAADFGAPTTRKRLFVIARCDGVPIRWPEPSHGPGRAQPWRTAAECIDWSIPCPSIFERKKPLKPATERRIAAGLKRYVFESAAPFIVPVCHTRAGDRTHGADEPLPVVTTARGGELALVAPVLTKYHGGARGETRGQDAREPLRTIDTENRFGLAVPFLAPVTHHGDARTHSVEEPFRTVTAANRGELSLMVPTLVQTGYGEREGQAPRALDIEAPLGTVVASAQKHGLVAAFLTKHYGKGVYRADLDAPLGTVTAREHFTASTVFLSKLYGTSTGSDVREPVPTVTAGGGKGGGHLAAVRAFLVKYYGTGEGQDARDPLHTITAKARFGLVTVDGEEYQIVDIGFRMLKPKELERAMAFRPDYDMSAARTQSAWIDLVGNSVCPPVAEAIVRANCLGDLAEAA